MEGVDQFVNIGSIASADSGIEFDVVRGINCGKLAFVV